MNSTFHNLLDDTLAEVRRREPAYSSSFPLAVCAEQVASDYAKHPLLKELTPGIVEKALTEGLAYVAASWPKAKQVTTESDPVAHWLCNSIVDAFCADAGLLELQPQSACGRSTKEILTQDYSTRHTSRGLCYHVRNRGAHPLLLISATGTPIGIWNQFLSDPTHDFKIILPQRRGGDLHLGGLRQNVDITTESDDLSAILDSEGLSQVDIVAWCNGARIAVDLAARREHKISSMVLLGPMLKGITGISPSPSNFERDLQPLLDAVAQDESLAPFIAGTIAKQSNIPDWARWIKNPVLRANALFAMPARDHACGMMAPLSDAESLINISRRVASDESYPMHSALARLKTRTMVIMGSHDSIVSNDFVWSAMQQLSDAVVSKVVVGGSGHYIQDLQYHYFSWLVTGFLNKRQSFVSTARISVEQLSRVPVRKTGSETSRGADA